MIPGPGKVAIRIEPDSAKTESGIVLPERRDMSKAPAQFGVVAAVGAPLKTISGVPVAFEVHLGDRVLFRRWRGTEVKVDGITHYFGPEGHVLAIIT